MAKLTTRSPSAVVRSSLDHPVIDCTGHILEMAPVIAEYVAEVGGLKLAELYRQRVSGPLGEVLYGDMLAMSTDERADAWVEKASWWNLPTNALDRATGMLPALMVERMDDMGIDFMLAYPTEGSLFLNIPHDELRQVACRAYNRYLADLLAPYRDRICPVAVIPMQTPGEALAELAHAVGGLGYRAAVFAQCAGRLIPKVAREAPALADSVQRPDWFGLDSPYDYDPVWAKCAELGVAVTFDSGGTAKNGRGSISNHLFNRQALFAHLHRPSCASLFYGGVTRRFPTVNFAWLEFGVAWACDMIGQIVGHWEKRGGHVIEELNPNRLDRDLLYKLIDQYGDDRALNAISELHSLFDRDFPRPPVVNEFAACGVESASDIVDLFATPFFFGCAGDDPTYAWALRAENLPFGVTLNAIYGSGISHWAVPDMTEVLKEAYEPIERGLVTPDQFRAFVFDNPVRLHAGMNPNFFEGTRVEAAVDAFLANDDSTKLPGQPGVSS